MGNVILNGELQIGDTSPSGDYDQLDVNGSIVLDGTTLDVAWTTLPSGGTTFTIVDNDGTDAVTGTFADLAEARSSRPPDAIYRFHTPAAMATISH